MKKTLLKGKLEGCLCLGLAVRICYFYSIIIDSLTQSFYVRACNETKRQTAQCRTYQENGSRKQLIDTASSGKA